MKIAVGLLENAPSVSVFLEGEFRDGDGNVHAPGPRRFSEPIVLRPLEPATASFVLDEFRIGIGFHWERSRRQAFRGDLRIVCGSGALTVINDVELESYVQSVIASEMSAASPRELLRAHAIVSRSWIVAQLGMTDGQGTFHSRREIAPGEWEVVSWYGHEGHTGFDVCADDHCQRYQGIPAEGTERAWRSVEDTSGRFLVFDGEVCDARFYKCCGGVTEDFAAAWADRDVPYLTSVYDGPGAAPVANEAWIRSASSDAYCNTSDPRLLERIFTGYDQETVDFFRWRVEYPRAELEALIEKRTGIRVGRLLSLEPLDRGRSGRIVRLRVVGSEAQITVGKELEIRRVLSRSHLYSSAFVVDQDGDRIALTGAGWGHGVGLCQVGAAVMAERGIGHDDILRHYYPGAGIENRS